MAPGEVHVSGGETRPAAVPRAELVRPVRQLVAAVLLFFALLVVSAIGIGLVKQRVDRRLDASVYRDAVALANASLRGGAIDQAEETLMAVGPVRPQLRIPLMWTFADSLAVMPEYRACVENDCALEGPCAEPRDSAALLRAEVALRSDRPGDTLALLPVNQAGIHAAAYRRAAAVACQDFQSLPATANGPEPTWLDALPRTSVLWTSPQARLARHPECMTEGNSPDADYLRAVAAFHEGRLAVAEEALTVCWAEGVQPADTAYMLGAIREAKTAHEEALVWYGRAVEARDDHFGAARAFVRIVREAG